MILLKNKYVQVEFWEDVPCIANIHLMPVLGKEFRNSLEQVLDLYKKLKKDHQELFWLADTRKFGVMSADDQEWIAREWNPRVYQAGLRYMAFIVPESTFGEISIKKYKEKVATQANSFETCMFEDVYKAKEWLKQMKKVKLAAK